ncbi:MAG: tetratricopeptide repeat protein [Thermodesulfovibrionales bacterium]|nr:tetratricopeptide repeat protein [Thermodesulfovibrionales bacterium]
MKYFKFIVLSLSIFSLSIVSSLTRAEDKGTVQHNAQESLSFKGMSVMQLIHKSREQVAANNLDAALRYIRLALTVDPAYAEVWKQLGRVLMLKGEYNEARNALQTALDLKQGDPEINAWIHTMMRPAEKTGETATRQKTPTSAGAWRDLGWSLWVKGQHDEAVSAWDQAMKNKVTNKDRLLRQVVARLAEEGYPDKAVEFLNRWSPETSFLSFGLELIKEKRYVAARTILLKAWETGQTLPTTGLYLGYVEANLYICPSVSEHLSPFLNQGIENIKEKEGEILVETILKCSSDAGILPLVERVNISFSAFPEYTAPLNTIVLRAADAQYSDRNMGKAFSLYQNVIKRDPEKPNVWFRLLATADAIGRHKEAVEILREAASRSSSSSIREGIQGKLMADAGDISGAIPHYRKSLTDDPEQDELRLDFFNLLLGSEFFDEAREEKDWFSRRLASGDKTARVYLAEMLSSLHEHQEAVKIWQELHLSYPENPRYAVETARSLFSLCRAKEAVSILEKIIEIKPTSRAYELIAEIEIAQGNVQQAFFWTDKAMVMQPSPGILKIRASAAESLGNYKAAREAAESVLKSDPGNIAMARIAGKALFSMELVKEAKSYYLNLIVRNEEFLPGLIALRDIAYDQQNPDDALKHTKQILDQRPWDINADIRYAVSLGVEEQFNPALKSLRDITEKDFREAVPVMAYDNVTQCHYSGRNTTGQIVSHWERLHNEGYIFIIPSELNAAADQLRTIAVIVDPEPDALPVLDSALKRIGGRAVLAIRTGSLSNLVPGSPDPSILKKLRESGRWIIASSGPETFQRSPVTSSGTLGNPLTHTIFSHTMKSEDETMMSKRLDTLLADASRELGSSAPRIFVYPGGDYGQFSLDTDPNRIETLKKSIGEQFDFAIAGDDYGFITQGFDPSRLSGRFVPPQWDEEGLMKHMHENNPLVRSHLELAKVLYWQSQYEKAHKAFQKAETLGADPLDVNFHWGNSAYQEGDLASALKRLNLAKELDPASKRILISLDRAENRARPLFRFNYSGWDDADNRSYEKYRLSVEGYVSRKVSLELFGDYSRWSRKNIGDEDGTRTGAGILWHFADERWVKARLWYLSVSHIDDHFGGLLNIHLPNAPFGGYVELEAERQEVDTVEAIREKTMANTYTLYTYSRIRDFWDLYADFSYTARSDNNDTYMSEGRFGYRFHEWPFLGAGYAFRFADSDRSPDEYWAPVKLQQHQLYAASRGAYKNLHYSLSVRAGYAEEEDTDWRFVWGTRLTVNYLIFSRLSLNGEINYLESPVYDRTAWFLGISFRF